MEKIGLENGRQFKKIEMFNAFEAAFHAMEQRYQGRWDENIMADYCWMLKRYLPQNKKKNAATKIF